MAGGRLPLRAASSIAWPPSPPERPLSPARCGGTQAGKAGSAPAQRLRHRHDGQVARQLLRLAGGTSKFSNLLQTDCGQPTPASAGSLSKILPGKTPWLLGIHADVQVSMPRWSSIGAGREDLGGPVRFEQRLPHLLSRLAVVQARSQVVASLRFITIVIFL